MVGLIFKCYIFSKSKLMILVFSTKQSEHTINQKPIILNAKWNCKSKKSPLKSNKKNSNLDPCSRFQGQFYFQQLPTKIWFWFQILRLFIVALPSPSNPTQPNPTHSTPPHPTPPQKHSENFIKGIKQKTPWFMNFVSCFPPHVSRFLICLSIDITVLWKY